MAPPSSPWKATIYGSCNTSIASRHSKLGIFLEDSFGKSTYRATRLVRFSLDEAPHRRSKDSRRSPSSVSKKPCDRLISKRVFKPGTLNRPFDGSFFVLGDDDNDKNLAKTVDPLFRSLSNWFSSLITKKILWKRVFFASKKLRSVVLINISTLIYASNIPVVKVVEDIMDPALFTVVRFSMSALPFLPFIFQAHRDSETRTAGLELGLWISLGYLTQALGLLTSDAGRASFISAFTVIVVPLMNGILGERISVLTWFGAIASLVGIGLIESSGSPPSIGDLLNLLSAVTFGVHMLRTEHYSRRAKKENFLALIGYEVCVVALSSAIWYFVQNSFFDIQHVHSISWVPTWDGLLAFPWASALYTGVFSTSFCLWAEMIAMRDVSATETAIIYGLEPLWGAAFAWFLLGERWGAMGWIGAVLLLGGSLSVQLFRSGLEKNKSGEEND